VAVVKEDTSVGSKEKMLKERCVVDEGCNFGPKPMAPASPIRGFVESQSRQAKKQ
jgi:hypothetical protein